MTPVAAQQPDYVAFRDNSYSKSIVVIRQKATFMTWEYAF